MSKISELSDGGSIQSGDTLIAVRSGGNVKVTYGGTTTANIDGGTIDGTVIGGSSAAAGSFTTLTATSANVNGNLEVSAANSRVRLFETDTTDLNTQLQNQAGDFNISRLDDDAGGSTLQFSIDHSTGNISIPNGNLDVTGTVTADGLTVDGNAEISSSNVRLDLFETDTTDLNTRFRHNGGQLLIRTTTDDGLTDTTRMSIDHATGDVSLFEDTGSTAKFFWDASAESLGIGTTSPSTILGATSLEVSNATGSEVIVFRDDGAAEDGDFCGGFVIGNRDASGTPNHYAGMWANTDTFGQMTLKFAGGRSRYEAGTPDMVIDIDGNVGIGTTTPAAKLEIGGAGEGIILASPDGTRYEITVANGGTLTVTAV